MPYHGLIQNGTTDLAGILTLSSFGKFISRLMSFPTLLIAYLAAPYLIPMVMMFSLTIQIGSNYGLAQKQKAVL